MSKTLDANECFGYIVRGEGYSELRILMKQAFETIKQLVIKLAGEILEANVERKYS